MAVQTLPAVMPICGERGYMCHGCKMQKRAGELEFAILKQDAHIARMIAHDPTQPSIRAAKRIAFMFRAELSYVSAGQEFTTAAFNAASARALKQVR